MAAHAHVSDATAEPAQHINTHTQPAHLWPIREYNPNRTITEVSNRLKYHDIPSPRLAGGGSGACGGEEGNRRRIQRLRRRGGEPVEDPAPEEARRGAAVIVAHRCRRCSSPPARRSHRRCSKLTRSGAMAAAALPYCSYSAPRPAAAYPRVRERGEGEREEMGK
uniref:Uncharacterized protein n=1 Tax=Oryza sativa subsp. japonica TaxID=39947 RepID=Q6YW06_ORYSJ|nr:hypothetical protein [Oryza sativa Japonica Group]BAD05860.1 hypothetical protein [Oryza sativa Japonica Group]